MGNIWPYMVVYGRILLYVVVYGCIWQYIAVYGRATRLTASGQGDPALQTTHCTASLSAHPNLALSVPPLG